MSWEEWRAIKFLEQQRLCLIVMFTLHNWYKTIIFFEKITFLYM